MKKQEPIEKMLSREQFTQQALKRDKGQCVFCGKSTSVVHHILERKLWPNRDGYYLSNAASVCDDDHWKCETTEYSVEQVRAACSIEKAALPPGFSADDLYDKWGNKVLPSGQRIPGPLFNDDGAQKALSRGGFLWLFLTD